MKIVLAGNWEWRIYEDASAAALRRLGHEVVPFAFGKFFEGRIGHYQRVLAAIPSPASFALNRALVRTVESTRPDLVFVWRGTHVWPSTLRALRRAGARVVSYNNDDAFGKVADRGAPWHHRYLWKWYLRGLRECDVNFVYRPVNVAEAIAHGARNVQVLPPYFVRELHGPVELTDADCENYECDIVFIGHYEPDGREKILQALVRAGLRVRLFGGEYWTQEVLGEASDYFGSVKPVAEVEYAKALRGAKMCLALLSTLNRDVYTRRCFEIPACGQPMVCQRTAELQRFFREDVEAIFFASIEELIEKVLWLKDRPEELAKIGAAGLARVRQDGHDADHRMGEMLAYVAQASGAAVPSGSHGG